MLPCGEGVEEGESTVEGLLEEPDEVLAYGGEEMPGAVEAVEELSGPEDTAEGDLGLGGLFGESDGEPFGLWAFAAEVVEITGRT